MAKKDVIGVENLIMDFAMQIGRIPKTDGIALIEDMCWAGGGNAASATVAVARLGGDAAIVGTVGNDAYGDFCKEDMRQNGVDVSHLKQIAGATSLCVCLAERETQGRSFLGKPGCQGDMTAEEVDETFVGSSKVLHISCIPSPAQKYAMEFAEKNGVEISMDAGAYSEAGKQLAERSDILIMSEDFYVGMFGDDENYIENCEKLLDGKPHIVIVTLGKKGCVGMGHGERFSLPAFSGDYAILDTTGAGDVFHGGFLYAYLYRYQKAPYNYTLKDCARFASVVSYINCLTLGGRPGIPTLSMVDRFLADGVVETGDIEERKKYYREGIFHKEK